MLLRGISLPKNYSFFLFGPRGTGKTTLLKSEFTSKDVLYIDLLQPRNFTTYSRDPEVLSEQLALKRYSWVVIDEVQKVPALLDLAHYHIESSEVYFALSGSSARKIKYGSANLLAGRAFTRNLFPFTYSELGTDFDLSETLHWGTLPKIIKFKTDDMRIQFLDAYTQTYLQQEILQEQVIRKLDPFVKFLNVAAQMSGDIINYTKIASEIGSTTPTVKSYFQILEDTLIGLILPAWNQSIRKRQASNPKFYFFDNGVQRALSLNLESQLVEGTYAYGQAFEQFVINEINRMLSYTNRSFNLSHLRTGSGAEIDLIVECSGKQTLFVEIKSKKNISKSDCRHLISIK